MKAGAGRRAAPGMSPGKSRPCGGGSAALHGLAQRDPAPVAHLDPRLQPVGATPARHALAKRHAPNEAEAARAAVEANLANAGAIAPGDQRGRGPATGCVVDAETQALGKEEAAAGAAVQMRASSASSRAARALRAPIPAETLSPGAMLPVCRSSACDPITTFRTRRLPVASVAQYTVDREPIARDPHL